MKKFQFRSILPTTFSRYTIPKFERKFPWMEVYVAFVASISFFCCGVVQAYTSPAIYSMESDGESNITLSSSAILWIATGPTFGAVIGTFASAPMLEYFGRQKTLVFITIPWLLGWILIGFSENVEIIICGRLFTGLSIGICRPTAPLYISETSSASSRGSLGFLNPSMNALGILFGLLVGCWLNWRNLALVIAIFPLMLLFLIIWLPESPLWLLLHGQEEKAFNSLERLRGEGKALKIQDELDDIKSGLEEIKISVKHTDWCKIIMRKENYMSFGLMILQQFTGISAVICYLSMILAETNTSGESGRKSRSIDATTAAISIGVVNFISSVVALPLIDRVGRRVLLICSGLAMFLSHSSLAIFLYYHLDPSDSFTQSTGSWLPLTSLCCFIAAFAIGFGPVPFVFMTEVLSMRFRSYLCSIATLIMQFGSLFTLQLFPILLKLIYPQFLFLAYAFVSLFGAIFVYFIIPETKGKTLAEIEKYFRESPTILEEKDENNCDKVEVPTIYIPPKTKIFVAQNTESIAPRISTFYCKSPAAL